MARGKRERREGGKEDTNLLVCVWRGLWPRAAGREKPGLLIASRAGGAQASPGKGPRPSPTRRETEHMHPVAQCDDEAGQPKRSIAPKAISASGRALATDNPRGGMRRKERDYINEGVRTRFLRPRHLIRRGRNGTCSRSRGGARSHRAARKGHVSASCGSAGGHAARPCGRTGRVEPARNT